MFSQFFGHYLLNNGVLTKEQLNKALDYKKNTYLKLGFLAVNAGYMDSKQVAIVHGMQEKIDKRFGEIAIDLGFLKEAQVDELLSTQKKGHLLLGQALIDNNIMSLDEINMHLNEYLAKHDLSYLDVDKMEHGDVLKIIDKHLNFENLKNEKVFKDYVMLFLRNIVRFIDSNVSIGKIELVRPCNTNHFASQQICGDLNIYTAISADEDVFLHIASKFSGELLEEMDELAKSSTAEFLNLHNGIFIVNMSNKEVELELMPQCVNENCFIDKTEEVFIIPVNITAGTFHLIISEKLPIYCFIEK